MTLNIVHFMRWKACFDFLSEPYSFVLLYKTNSQDLIMVVKMSPQQLFVREILKEANLYRLQSEIARFQTTDMLVDFYHENFLYNWSGDVVTRFKLKRAVYNHVLSLQYLARLVLKRNQISIPYAHLKGTEKSKYF